MCWLARQLRVFINCSIQSSLLNYVLWWVFGRPGSAGACTAGQLEPGGRAVWCIAWTRVRRRRCTSCQGSIRLSAPNAAEAHPAARTLNYCPVTTTTRERERSIKTTGRRCSTPVSIGPLLACRHGNRTAGSFIPIIYTWNTRELSGSEPLSSTVSELLLLVLLPSIPMLPGDLGVCGRDCK